MIKVVPNESTVAGCVAPAFDMYSTPALLQPPSAVPSPADRRTSPFYRPCYQTERTWPPTRTPPLLAVGSVAERSVTVGKSVVDLRVQDQRRLDLDELSALALRGGASDRELVAVADSSFVIALGHPRSADPTKTSVDLRTFVSEWTHRPQAGSQWEGVACDASGRVFVLQEHAGKKRASHVFVFASSLDELLQTIALDVDQGKTGWERAWMHEENARGEALVLLRDGHLLVFKQKDPVQLIEFGMPGDVAGGFGPDRVLEPTDSFELDAKSTFVRYEPLASWGLGASASAMLGSVNDAAVADGELYVVSRSSHLIARLDSDVEAGEPISIGAVADIPTEIEHPEGLVLLEGAVPLVGNDRPADDAGPNLFLLSAFDH